MSTRLPLLLMLALVPGLVHALGLGKLQLDSALNEPFEARIELLSATIEELDSLDVRLADEIAFRRADIPRPYLLTDLNFAVKQTESGPDYIRIYSDTPIREPFLNFLLEVTWAKGRLYREYTVLLDPPIYADAKTRQRLALTTPSVEAETSGTITGIEDNRVVYNPDYTKPKSTTPRSTTPAAAPAISRPVNYTGGDYGPTISGDTLWSIASAMRPDDSISVQQMMFALLRANPEAFINGNINGLKRGEVLKLPAQSEVQSQSKEEAFAQTRLQNGLWEEARQAVATAVTPRPEISVVPEPETPTAAEPEVAEPEPQAEPQAEPPAPVTPVLAEPESEPELRLVAPAAEGEAQGAAGPGGEQLANELALANESLEALTLENLELKDKLSETETIIDDLNRLIVLKESELAALQQKIKEQEDAKAAEEAAAQQEQAEAVEPAVETPAIEEPVVEETAPVEEVVPAEVTEAPVEEPATEVEAVPAEATTEEAIATEAEAPPEMQTAEAETEAADVSAAPMIPPAISAIIEVIKSNALYIGGGLGVLVLIYVVMASIKRRQSESAMVIPQSAFPDFAEEPTASEDATDINPALAEADAESPTLLPDSDDETVTPEFGGDDATQVISAQSDPDAFQIPAAGQEGDPLQEVDPLHDVNIFLAYEQFDQAEQFVKKVIQKDPDNLEFHSKLLEVYYAANNKKGYENAARVLHDKVNGKGDYWNMAVAMWQEISPNRALFAQPAADEEDEAATPSEGGGIVNIAGDGGASGLDLDLDTTAGSGEVLDMTTTDDQEADVLDVTAAVDMDDIDDAVLEMSADADQPLELPGKDEAMLDISLDIPEPDDHEAATAQAADDNSLDFSLDLGTETAAPESGGDALGLSLDINESASDAGLDISLDAAKEDAAVEQEGNLMDYSFDLDKPEAPAEDALGISISSMESDAGLDISLDASQDNSSPAPQEDNLMDFSFELETPAESAADAPELSLDQAQDVPAKSSTLDALDTSFNISEDDKGSTKPGQADLLDVTSAISLDDEIEAEPAVADDSGLLDVTRAKNFEPDNEQDLLDVTSTTASADMDALDILNVNKAGTEASRSGTIDFDPGVAAPEVVQEDNGGLDFELAPDDDTTGGAGAVDTGFAGIDITTGQGTSGDILEFALDTDNEVPEIDMDSTMQIPNRATIYKEVEAPAAPAKGKFSFVIEKKDADADSTIMVPRSKGIAEQSADDEIATQLDLAKAYVELGDKDNARIILDEVMAIGNAQQKQQAQELLSQI